MPRAKGPTPEVAAKIAAIHAMRDRGLTWKQIGEILGVSRQRVHALASRREDGTAYRSPSSAAYEKRTARERYHVRHPEARYYDV